MPLVSEVTHYMGLVPLAWLLWRGERRPVWWWIAGAFAVSWLADTAAHWVDPWFVAAVYPVSQVGILALVLAPRKDVVPLIGLLVAAGLVAVLWEGTTGPDLFLETVAAGVAVSVVWPLADARLRAALLMAFGFGWVAGVGYALWPGWTSWGVYQSVRALSLGLFCWAAWKPQPMFRVVA